MMNDGADPRHQPVAVVGAGIVGVATAIWLRRAGHEVVLIDRAGPGAGASFGNGGVLASCAVVPVTVPGLVYRAPAMLFDRDQPLFLRWRHLPRLMPWLVRYLRHAGAPEAARIARALRPIIGDSLADHQALSDGTPAARYVVTSDYLYIYRDRAAFEAEAFGWGIRRAAGFVWEELEGDAVARYDPALAAAGRFAVRLGGHGRISDPGAYVAALAAHFEGSGGKFVRAAVTGFDIRDGRVRGLRLDGATMPVAAAVVTAGAWSGGLVRQLGLRVPLESERGYHLELWEPDFMPRVPVMVSAGKFVITPMDGRLRLAGIVEFGGLDAPASEAPFELLERQLRRAMPDLRWKSTTRWMGHRPAPADSIPLIGAVPGLGGAYVGFGHHHVGLTGGPRTGFLLAQLVSGATPNLDLAPYAPSRFQ